MLHRRTPLERRRIAFALWPDVGEEEALANLRRHLHALGTVLPPAETPWLTTSRVSVTWNATGCVDVVAFEEALEAGDDERAVNLYHGELCPAVDEEWADSERRRLARGAQAACERLIERERGRDTERAIAWAAESLRIDPWHEASIRTLIELRSRAGDAAGARREYHEFAARFDREYGAPPDPETTAAYERVVAAAPAPRTPAHLPQSQHDLLGRDTEVATLLSLLERERLVTIVGFGGMGKTRLALAVGAKLVDRFSDGVRFAELVGVSDPNLVASSIASSAGIVQAGYVEAVDAILAQFGDRLIIVDNCEHVLDATAGVIDTIVRNVPQARILATSREPLRVQGEAILRLEPLPTLAAIALFNERARTANPRFALTQSLYENVAEICRRLDGNPLAIELAAARLNILRVDQIQHQLDARFRLLVNGKREPTDHHRALRASLDWSHELLDARDRRVFARLAIFAASFSLEAASALCGDRADPFDLDVVDSVTSLLDKSLLVPDDSTAERRFGMLESVRMYAREQLALRGESDAIAERHLRATMAEFELAGDQFAATPRDAFIIELAPLLPDARAALGWALTQAPSEIEKGARLLCATSLWDRLHLFRECGGLAQSFLAALPPGRPDLAARLWRLIAYSYDRDRRESALEPALRAVACGRESGDSGVLADALTQQAFVMIRFGRFEAARAALGEARDVAPPTSARRLSLLAGSAYLASLDGDLDTAAREQSAIMETHRFLGNRLGEARAAMNLAEIEHARGNTSRAIQIVHDHRLLADDAVTPVAVTNLNYAGYLLAQGFADSALAPARAGFEAACKWLPGGELESIAIGHFALIAALGGDLRRATQLLGYVDRLYRERGVVREHNENFVRAKLLALIDAKFFDADRDAALAEGASWSRERAVDEVERLLDSALARPSAETISAEVSKKK